MLITDTKSIEKYAPKYRLWQGISSIERTKKGRIFLTYYSGGVCEEIRNYCILSVSDDDGKSFREPVAVMFDEGERYFDPCIWIDPLGRLWFTFTHTRQGEYDLCAVVCDDPDADELVFHEERRIGDGVMMCKPTVLSTGEWLFPITKWRNGRMGGGIRWNESEPEDRKAFAYKTSDNGKTFERLGGVDAPTRSFDEHMIVERQDGSLWMWIRCTDGIAEAFSWDGGKNWTEPRMSEIKGPDARFCIRRLSSGKLLLLNHHNFVGRNNMTAFLSDDDGKTWKWQWLLEERRVSYPDAVEADGVIYITYDFERGGYRKTVAENEECAREILMTKITEADIMAGKPVSEECKIGIIASKLGKYEGDDNPCEELDKYTPLQAAEQFLKKHPKEEVAFRICEAYPFSCLCVPNDSELDDKIAALNEAKQGSAQEKAAAKDLISFLRLIHATPVAASPVVDRAKELLENDLLGEYTLERLAQEVGISKYYLSHLFKKHTGVNIPEYRKARRMILAKKRLLSTQETVTEIAYACGFGSASYFTEQFVLEEGMTPTEYRKLHKS